MYNGNIVLLGPPGSGKGTLGKQLSQKYEYELISTGEILRDEKKSGRNRALIKNINESEIGKNINDILGKGNLVPDEIVNNIIKNKIGIYKYLDGQFILDGFPRNIKQAEFLDTIGDIGLVIYLEVSDNIIRERILERGKSSGREDDQNIYTINNRILQYNLETKPLIDFYNSKKILATIDGEKSIKEVFNRVENIIKLWK
jgi:adenylate kinase